MPSSRSTVPLVVAPLSITDENGRPVDGLSAADLKLFDNGVAQKFQLTEVGEPLSLVFAIQANPASQAAMDKLKDVGSLLSDLLAGDAGETALLAFAETSRVLQAFTADTALLTRALHHLKVEGHGSSALDALHESMNLLAKCDPSRRSVALLLGNSRDIVDKAQLNEVVRRSETLNVEIYRLDFSTFLTSFTAKRKTVWDRMTDEQKNDPARMQGEHKYPVGKEQDITPPDSDGGSLLKVISHAAATDMATPLTSATGGRRYSFTTLKQVQAVLQAVATDLHRKYFISFQPTQSESGAFHGIRVEVNGRPGLEIKTRAGYWVE